MHESKEVRPNIFLIISDKLPEIPEKLLIISCDGLHVTNIEEEILDDMNCNQDRMGQVLQELRKFCDKWQITIALDEESGAIAILDETNKARVIHLESIDGTTISEVE
jgi:hypothetical protein